MLKGKKILIGVTGGIAIYKTLDLISKLRKLGAEVEVIMTESAVKFINPITFETMSDNRVYTDMWIHPKSVLHIDITNDKDVFLVAPASANTMAKVNAGMADNLLTASILASKAPVVFAVAMNTNMLINPITQRNIEELRGFGYDFIDSNSGQLACNTVGAGRMAEPLEIIDYLEGYFTKKDLAGKTIIVTAGGSLTRIDPVRYISNDSSGKMGYNLAKQARNRGAHVIYITGRVVTDDLDGLEHIQIESNDDLEKAIKDNLSRSDGLIMAAAPVDFKVAKTADNKIKKDDSVEEFNLELLKTKDILKEISKIKTDQKIIGFAAETQNLRENALKKLEKKKLDYIIANDVSREGAGFNVDTNIVTIIGREFEKEYPLMSKEEVANLVLDLLV